MPAMTSPRPTERDSAWIPGGVFRMGSDVHYPEEAPAHDVEVTGFYMDRYTVTNGQYDQFVRATGYVTLAERPANPDDYPDALPELLEPSSLVFQSSGHGVDMHDPYSWWRYVPGADWRHPRGPNSSYEDLEDHPVVHIAYEDALAYARWAGKELPSEAEWEFAARGGIVGAEFVWGNSLKPDGKWMANTWQGEFPRHNSLEDGFEWTSPVGSFAPNGYGLYDMAGNVWEWTIGWYQPHSDVRRSCCVVDDPRGGRPETSYDPRTPSVRIPRKVIKGGSYLCAPNYCRRYRPAARMAQPIDTSTCHVGFRCITRPASAR